MSNRNERKRKLEQQRLLLILRIARINKRQDELILNNILLDAQKEELEFKSQVLEGLIGRVTRDLVASRQIVEVFFKNQRSSIVLFMN